jgi:TATA-box binding protein (TBP) (component of TFIID and TFIIIB)
MYSLGDLKKSSCMIDGMLSSKFDLNNIYSYFPFNGTIVVCLKFNNKKKSSMGEETCKTFNNQITLILQNGINIKIFNTGAFSVSGAGNIDEGLDKARESILEVLECLKKVRFTKEITPIILKDFYTFHETSIVTPTSIKDLYECKHTIKGNSIIIGGEKCERFHLLEDIYIDIKHQNKIKKLYNNLAQEIGKVEYIMNRKTKSLCIKDCTYSIIEDNLYDILNKYNTSIGKLKITLDKTPKKIQLPDKVKIDIKICRDDTVLDSIKFSNCNYNFQVKMDKTCFIDRDKICIFLEGKKISYTYDPCSYPGVKFSIDKTKITIFRTGSILLSSKEDIYVKAYPFIVEMFKIDMTCKPIENIEPETELSIWDL